MGKLSLIIFTFFFLILAGLFIKANLKKGRDLSEDQERLTYGWPNTYKSKCLCLKCTNRKIGFKTEKWELAKNFIICFNISAGISIFLTYLMIGSLKLLGNSDLLPLY